MRRNHYLLKEFGFGSCKKSCPCPTAARKLCRTIRFHDRFAPRVHGKKQSGTPRFTPIQSRLFEHWGEYDPGSTVKLTYLFLVTRTFGRRRLIFQRMERLALERGLNRKTFQAHLRKLQEVKLILVRPRAELDREWSYPGQIIVVLDRPEWLRDELPKDYRFEDEDEDGVPLYVPLPGQEEDEDEDEREDLYEDPDEEWEDLDD